MVISTGCSTLDRLLEGGVQPKNLTLIYGEAETGKTTLALQCSVNCARMGMKTLYIDSDGSFTTQRLIQIAAHDYNQIAENILLAKPVSFQQQTYVIDQLEDLLTENVGLIVIDTITSLYRAELAENPKKTFRLNRELNRQLAYLAQTARVNKKAILITSQVRSIIQQQTLMIEPVATRVLKFWADVVLNLKPTAYRGIIEAILEKPENRKLKKCFYKITRKGIEEHAI